MAFAFLPFLSGVFGWVYTICWSLSFYPQPLLNLKRRSTSGTTVDFPLINTLGFLAYFVYTVACYYSRLIRAQYAARHHGLTPTVQFNDIIFAAHAFVLCVIVVSQYWPALWGFAPNAGTRPSRFILGLATGCIAGVVIVVLIVAGGGTGSDTGSGAASGWVWLDATYALSYVKLVVTLVKYAPQLLANFRNKSTRGWSIWTILLDFIGGVLSIAQQSIDSYLQGDWSGITGNPVKFALGNISSLYDICFITQHYVLYRHGGRADDNKTGEREALLENGEVDRRLD